MNRLFFLLVAIAYGIPVVACDVCGSSAGNQYMGILPQGGNHFVGLQYQHRGFKTKFPPLFASGIPDSSVESYNTLQVWGRYQLNDRIQLFAFLPYQHSIRTTDTGSYSLNGIGDVSVLANMVVLKGNEEKKWQHYLQGGVGVKMPTGSYKSITDMDRQGIPNLQPGTGSWDITTNANYTVTYEKAGLNADLAYTFTTVNKYDLKYGNRFNGGLMAFYRIVQGELTILPQAGLRYEHAQRDHTSYSKEWVNKQSGGYICYAAVGVQAIYQRFGLRAVYSKPVAQDFALGYIKAKGRVETGLLLFF